VNGKIDKETFLGISYKRRWGLRKENQGRKEKQTSKTSTAEKDHGENSQAYGLNVRKANKKDCHGL